jgi:hypothetical protein
MKKYLLYSRVVLVFCFFVGISVVILQEGQKDKDVEQFLEKIKLILQRFEQLQKNLKKEKNEEAKKRIREKIIEKISNPFYYYQRHREIKVGKPNSSSTTQQKVATLEVLLPKDIEEVPKAVSTFLKRNPQLVPFQFPNFEQILQKSKTSPKNLENFKVNQNNYAVFDEEALSKYFLVKVLLDQTIENLYNFWAMVWLIIKDPARLQYLKFKLCPEEVDEKVKEP